MWVGEQLGVVWTCSTPWGPSEGEEPILNRQQTAALGLYLLA